MTDAAVEDVPAFVARTGIRAVAAASVGNLLEWYDFTVYAFFAAYIGQNFFPSADHSLDLVKSFLAFGVGFVVRPLGAIVIGGYGDRVGRKAALTLTILVMALGTGLIAVTPGYAAIGFWAPLLLLTGRVLQGFSAGGEVGGAAAFLVENAPPGKRGVFASWLQASMAMSNILGAMVGFAVTTLLVKDDVVAWGWRIPFFIGLLIAPVGLYLRRTLDETPEFQAEMARRRGVARAQGAPLLLAFRDHWRALLKGLGLCVLWAVGPYTLIIPMPAYVQSVLHYSGPQSFASALISDVVLAFTCFAAGALSDRIGRRKVLAASAVLVFIGAAPLFFWLQQSHHMITLVTVQCSFCLIVGLYLGVAPAALAELFATKIRASGMALTYTTAVVALGAFAPAIMAGLSSTLGAAALAPAWYVTAAAVASLIAIGFLPSRTPVDD